MPSASKSKAKDRAAAFKAAKEQPKVAVKPIGNGTVASTYNNNLSGKFHLLEPSSSLLGSQGSEKLRNTDEIDEHSRSSHGTGDFDCASNNGSCSGESEDTKEKSTSTAPRVDSVPGCDLDKREKIRQKNEKKHQRQKERRAQELHERCKGYLMSRKLETLAQKLVAMGFSADHATMALIHNEGCLEESVAWLCNFDGSEETKQQVAADQQSGANLKINITEEVAKIVILEAKFKCTKQEVERAVVSCEGDLEKAEEVLKTQKQESATTASKPEGSGDPSGLVNKQQVMLAQNPARPQANGFSSVGVQQMRRDEKDLNYKLLLNGSGPKEPAVKGFQPLATPMKPEMVRQQFFQPEKRRLNAVPTVPYVTSSPLPVAVSQMKSETRHLAAGNEMKSAMHNGGLRESVVVMQRPQSAAAKQSLPSTSHSMFASEPSSREWYLNGASGVDMMVNGGLGNGLRNMNLDSVNSAKQFMHANHQQSFVSNPIELAANGWGGTWGSGGTSSSQAVASSLGMHRGGWSPSESSSTLSHGDWRTNGPAPCDYTSIDWSLDTTLLNPAAKSEWLSDTWSTMFMGGRSTRPSGNLGGAGINGLHDSNLPMDPAPSPRPYEWPSFCRGGSS
ncbi:uncharacterized protein LOC100839304 [Brachypodium distachyon]|uniref:UBA domain-containing protein n=1 Tax=Brachypodium distachyon TaxID=15368 RepID=I1HJH3_BRADI|nr:uncharacterized protein LOC100839304 [Brachypodium distachyon]KQK06294.1 hypothetical protein BRADI_2g25540v3 [Brachypodium distachyon]|eukprot:XP_003568466.1 uncharacterized protein LOC100839304 [Brachypodium distachyon]